MDEHTSPEVIQPMKQLGEDVAVDPYDVDVPDAEEQTFQEDLAVIDATTSYLFDSRL